MKVLALVLTAYYLLAWLFCFSYMALYAALGFRYYEAVRNAGLGYYLGDGFGKLASLRQKHSIALNLLKDRPEKSARLFCFLIRHFKKAAAVFLSAPAALVLAFTAFANG